VTNAVVIVDASLAAMWALPEPRSAQALMMAQKWGQDNVHLLAPCLLIAELTNALYKRVLRDEMDLTTAESALGVIFGFGVELREEPGLAARALSLAAHLKRPTTYDCHYLALAERYDCALWTGDQRFYNAVHRAEPRVKWIGAYSAPPPSAKDT
jgi:predicted nucleic acid-binding protein